jgi:hypothetical protein
MASAAAGSVRLIEDAGGGTGRQRPWRVAAEARTWGRDNTNADLNVVGDEVSEILLDREVAALREWRRFGSGGGGGVTTIRVGERPR